MELQDAALYEDDRSIIEQTLRESGVKETWQELAERGWTKITYQPLILRLSLIHI